MAKVKRNNPGISEDRLKTFEQNLILDRRAKKTHDALSESFRLPKSSSKSYGQEMYDAAITAAKIQAAVKIREGLHKDEGYTQFLSENDKKKNFNGSTLKLPDKIIDQIQTGLYEHFGVGKLGTALASGKNWTGIQDRMSQSIDSFSTGLAAVIDASIPKTSTGKPIVKKFQQRIDSAVNTAVEMSVDNAIDYLRGIKGTKESKKALSLLGKKKNGTYEYSIDDIYDILSQKAPTGRNAANKEEAENGANYKGLSEFLAALQVYKRSGASELNANDVSRLFELANEITTWFNDSNYDAKTVLDSINSALDQAQIEAEKMAKEQPKIEEKPKSKKSNKSSKKSSSTTPQIEEKKIKETAKTEPISSDEEKTKIRTKNKQIWRDFYEFVITSSDKDFVDHLGDWMIEDAALYLYLFTLRYTMIDNRAKNVFPHWAKHYMSTAEAASAGDDAKNYTIDDSKAAINNGYRFDFWDYDNDSAIGINNSGELTMSYGKEDTDYKTDGDPSSGYIFNAAESVLWCRIRDLMQPQLRTMYQSVDSNCWSAEHLINEFGSWQEQFPEELWRIHYERLYLRTYQAGTVRFLQEMMNGRKKYQRRQWERDQHAYMGTKFVHTDVKSDQIMFRCNTPKEAVVKPNYTLRIVPYSDMYISVLYGNSANPAQIRAKAGQEYEITTNLTNMDDTAVLIYCASRIQALNDLSACYIHDNDFSKATKLKTLIIGNSTKGYQNTFLTNLNMGNNILLEELNVQNCPNLTGSINLSACENLIKLNASGTVITSVSFATHGKIKHAYLPSTINTLAFKDLQELTDLVLPSYENLETFVCRNSVVDALDIIKKSSKTLKTVTVTGINWNLENTNILKVLAKLTGKDENEFNTDHSILTGTIHLPVIRDQELKEYIGTDEEKGIWTELEITYDSLIVQFKITCVNADKAHTVLDVQYVDKGSDGEDPITRSVNPIPIPTIPSTIENDFIYKRWDSEFTKVFADRTITAVYEPSVRNYNVEYILKPTPNAAETVLQSSVGPYGSTIEYTGDLPKYTAEEAAYKYYLFKEWDKSGLVTGNKKIYTVFDSCEYSTGYFDGKDLENLSEVELYTLMKMNLERDKTEAGDTINFKLGIDYDYNDVESKEFISETTEFDGTNYIDTKVSIMDKDRDFTFAIDFEFGSENTSGATLAQCFQSNGSNGFRLWYNSNVNLNWGTKSMTPSGINDRELVVIRHKAGSEQAYVYCSNLSGNEVSIDTLAAIRIPVTTSTLVFGCSKADDGSYEKYAKGKIHWAKLWYSDLGDNECREIASWTHESIPMMVAKYKEYYLSDNATKRANITFIAKNLLSTNHSYGNITGGWSKSSLNTWLNTRLIKAVSPIWKSLIKKVNVTANNADKAKTTSTSECYFYLPSIHEIEPSISNDPYSIETDSTISYMTNDIARRRAKVSTPDQYEAYPTRSANVDQNVGTWQWGVDGGEDTPGKINGYYYPQTAGVLIMFSISCEG